MAYYSDTYDDEYEAPFYGAQTPPIAAQDTWADDPTGEGGGEQPPPVGNTVQGKPNIPLHGLRPPQGVIDVFWPGWKIEGDALVFSGDPSSNVGVSDPELAYQGIKKWAEPLGQRKWQDFFKALYDTPVARQELLTNNSLGAALKAAGFNVTPPNAQGGISKVQTPDGEWVRVIEGDPVAGGKWTWVGQGGGTPSVSHPGAYPNWVQQGALLEGFNEPFVAASDYPDYEPLAFDDLPEFKAPTAESVLEKPGYKFRLGEGEKGLRNNAAAEGILRTGGTLKDFLKYNQNFASNEYQNEFNRELEGYDRGVANKLALADRRNQQHITDYSFGKQGSDDTYNRLWAQYLQRARQFSENSSRVYDRLKWQTEAGLDAAKSA